jgi:integrase
MRREQALQQVEPTGAALSLATINKTKGFIRAAFNIAVAQLGHVRESPWQGIGSDPVPETPIRYVTAEEFVAILNAVHDLEQSVWWRALLTTLYTVGLRYSEAIHLTIGDLDFERDTIQVAVKPESRATIAWSPKTYQTRTIPAPAMTMTLLAQLLEKAPEGHAYVFLTAERLAAIKGLKAAGEWHGLRSVVNNVVRSFRHTVVRAAGCVPSLLDGDNKASVSMHDLRRTCITNWSRSVNMQTVMRMAGHSRIETTMRYYAATTEDQLDLVRQTSTASLAQTDAKLTQNTLPDPCCSLGRVGNSRSD